MLTIILLIHLMLAIALVGLVLVQRSEGGALGIGGSGGGGGGGFLSGRGTANLLTRSTTVVAALFIVTSLTLAKLSGGPSVQPSILDTPMSTPSEAPAPSEPTAPLAR